MPSRIVFVDDRDLIRFVKAIQDLAGIGACSRRVAAGGRAAGIAALGALVAEQLGSTPAIARKSSIHPAVLTLAKDREAVRELQALRRPRATKWLAREERALLALLETAPESAKLLTA